MRASLKDAAQGRWRSILPALGLPTALLNGKHGACPICQAGKDRFRFDDKDGRGTWICSTCGAGNGIDLVMQMRGLNFKEAAAQIEALIGTAPYVAPSQEPTDEAKRRWMNELWNGAQPISAEDPAGLWLAMRTGLDRFPASLRYHDNVSYADVDGGRSYAPGMLAKVTDRDGVPVNVHRTYLTYRGEKAPIAKPRAMMPGALPPTGAAVRLSPLGEVLGIAEGIETAFAASRLHDVPCWAALNAPMLTKWQPPTGVRKVIIFGDNDANYVGQRAAYQLANQLTARNDIATEVRIPESAGTDWADVLTATVLISGTQAEGRQHVA